jgi:hypothetical protein
MQNKLVLTLAVASLPLLAQPTWKGLRFGMSEEEIRKAYPGNLAKKPKNSPDETVLVDEGYKLLGDSPYSALVPHANAKLLLEKDGKLKEVIISTDTTNPDQTTETMTTIEETSKGLVERYGMPIKEGLSAVGGRNGIIEGKQCPYIHGGSDLENMGKLTDLLLGSKLTTCQVTWRADGQTIELYWNLKDGGLSLFYISYKPTPTDF